jgi:hypothetical protein
MTRGQAGILALSAAALAALAALLIQATGTNSNNTIQVELSINDISGDCVQTIVAPNGTREATDVIKIQQGDKIQYSGENGKDFTLTFPTPGVFEISTGSPFDNGTGGWQRDIRSNAGSFTTGRSRLTFFESAAIVLGSKSAGYFSYQSMTVGGHQCHVQNGGIHIDR